MTETSTRPRSQAIHGNSCQVCKFDFHTQYGDLGHEYIEAHHLMLIAETGGTGTD
jgi:5-methylcytosine-specific restriction protein A